MHVRTKAIADGGIQLPGTLSSPTVGTDGAGNMLRGTMIYVSSATPSPPVGSGDYVWFKTDGAGNVTDIMSGNA